MTKGERNYGQAIDLFLAPARPVAYQILRNGGAKEADVIAPYIALLNRRAWDRRNAAYGRCAGRQGRCRDKCTIALRRRRTIRISGFACHTGASKGVAVG